MKRALEGKFIAVANMKGGVGKTTTVISLAESLAADDPAVSVLVVDLDPQASASICLAGDELLTELIETGRTVEAFLETRLIGRDKSQPLMNFIRQHFLLVTHKRKQLGVSLLPCSPELRMFERSVVSKLTRRRVNLELIQEGVWELFQREFAPLQEKFDYVIFDCPPGISIFAEAAIRGSNLIIVPTIPDRISNFGLDAFCASLWEEAGALPKPPMPHVLISRVLPNVRQHREMLQRLEAEASADDAAFRLFATRIPQSATLAAAISLDTPQSFSAKYGLDTVQVLESLVREVKELFHADRH